MAADIISKKKPADSNTRQMAVATVLLLLAIIGLGFDWEKNRPVPHQDTTTADTLPDTIIDNPQLDSFDDTGRKIRQLKGTRITYFDSDKRNLIDAPHLYLQQKQDDEKSSPVPWDVTADHGIAYQTSSIVELHDNVVLSSNATPGGPTRISTEYLRVDADRKFAETDKAVTIHARNSESHAMGMQADIAHQHLLLPSRVKEIHEAPR